MNSNARFSFDPIPSLSLNLKAKRGAGFQLDCTIGVADKGWFLRGSYQQTTGHIVVDLRFDPEIETGRFDLHQRNWIFDIGHHAELSSDISLLFYAGYSKSRFEPDDFLLVLPSGGAQFDHRGALRQGDGGFTVAAGVRWKATEAIGIEGQLRYLDKSMYELTDAGIRSEVLGRVGATVKLSDTMRIVLEDAIGEQSRVSNLGLRWSF
ncbi:MAG: hypothetical protein K0U72_13400 [Gammaproteobacteria bacterium]|nr:hypothetical protein [Gammaproteobacteria bacterium]